uniref:Uncharacterized protein n=1 Tax=Bombyx mori TaxID=7091 RepID=Q8MTQ1_BOMMO|nr:putative protein [Bombyx mori]
MYDIRLVRACGIQALPSTVAQLDTFIFQIKFSCFRQTIYLVDDNHRHSWTSTIPGAQPDHRCLVNLRHTYGRFVIHDTRINFIVY